MDSKARKTESSTGHPLSVHAAHTLTSLSGTPAFGVLLPRAGSTRAVASPSVASRDTAHSFRGRWLPLAEGEYPVGVVTFRLRRASRPAYGRRTGRPTLKGPFLWHVYA